jgi:hypothetical protein
MQNAPLEGRLGWAVWEYSFALHGGAVSSIAVAPKLLPAGAIIMDGIVHVKTACTSGGSATVAIQALAAEDILAATAVASLTLNALLDVVPVGTAATMIRCTAATQLTFVIATAALTAGVISVGLRWGLTD